MFIDHGHILFNLSIIRADILTASSDLLLFVNHIHLQFGLLNLNLINNQLDLELITIFPVVRPDMKILIFLSRP